MKNIKFKLSYLELNKYFKDNAYATVMFCGSGDSYVAARCLILNSFADGYILFSQSVEKFLKAYLFLSTHAKTSLKGNDRHNPYLLKEELKKASGTIFLDKYDELLKKLYGHFQSRYHDSRDQSRGMSSSELLEYDEMWLNLLENAPIPKEILYRTKFFAELCDARILKNWPMFRFWLLANNHQFRQNIKKMDMIYKLAENYYISISKGI